MPATRNSGSRGVGSDRNVIEHTLNPNTWRLFIIVSVLLHDVENIAHAILWTEQ